MAQLCPEFGTWRNFLQFGLQLADDFPSYAVCVQLADDFPSYEELGLLALIPFWAQDLMYCEG
jgi:hypothetical protein